MIRSRSPASVTFDHATLAAVIAASSAGRVSETRAELQPTDSSHPSTSAVFKVLFIWNVLDKMLDWTMTVCAAQPTLLHAFQTLPTIRWRVSALRRVPAGSFFLRVRHERRR